VGDLKVVASAELGGLGTKNGPPAHFTWTWPSFVPSLLPWLAMLGLLALPSNRNGRAWWILLPLASWAALNAGLEASFGGLREEGASVLRHGACAASFGLAAVWLLGAGLGRRSRLGALALMVPVMAAFTCLAFSVTPAWEELWDSSSWDPLIPFYTVLYWVACGVLAAGALSLTGRMCRRRFGPGRVAVWLLFWLLVLCLALVTIVCAAMAVVSSSDPEWTGPIGAGGLTALVGFAVCLPFLILSFASSFWRERLASLLHVPSPVASVPAAIVADETTEPARP
jgi:hypothetical protein